MKLMFMFLTLLNTFSLFAGLKPDKIGEALVKAQFLQCKDQFFYSLSEDTSTIEIVDKLNQSSSDKKYGPYRLILKDIEPGTRFGLYQFNLLGIDKPPFVCTGYIDQNGEAWLKKKEGDMKLFNMQHIIGGMLPGEPTYAMVVLGDQTTYIAACLVPNPLEVYGTDGRHVMMQLFTHNHPQYMIFGDHFRPGEDIVLSIHSKAGVVTKLLKASNEGTFRDMVEGDCSHGQLDTDSIKISSALQTDPMIISYDWKFLGVNGGKKMCNKAMRVKDQAKR